MWRLGAAAAYKKVLRRGGVRAWIITFLDFGEMTVEKGTVLFRRRGCGVIGSPVGSTGNRK